MTNETTEAPLSTTIKSYYKGYSIMLTMRDPEVDAKPLLKKAMASIDWMVEQKDFNPSWKTDDDKPKKQTKPKKKKKKRKKKFYEFDGIHCPDCGREVWDNRGKKASGKFSKKSPDFACKDSDNCGWAVWPEGYKIVKGENK